MKFERFVFGVALNKWSVAKYTDGDKVKIIAEHEDGETGESLSFDSRDEYNNWVDSVVEYDTQIKNQAEALSLILVAMRERETIGWGGAGRGQGRKPSDDPRDIRKQLRWTKTEWSLIANFAEKQKLSVADFQRKAILDKCN